MNYNDFEELIYDKGIKYKTGKFKNSSDLNSFEPKEYYKKDFFEEFKEFILFQKMIPDK